MQKVRKFSRSYCQEVSKERNMFVAERFISDLIKTHGRDQVSPDGGTWYPMACRFIGLEHHIHSFSSKESEKHYRKNHAVHQRQN